MSLRKACSASVSPTLPSGHTNPLYCAASPNCSHHWFYDFRVNRRRYRSTTETHHKGLAKSIEAKERSRVLEAKHQIRTLPDVSFREFTGLYLRNHAELHKKSVDRDREIIANLNRAFGSIVLHELAPMRIEQYKRERLAGRWRGKGYTGASKPIKPATVNRELDTLQSLLSKAVEWKYLREHPMAGVQKLKVKNRRTRILTDEEQAALLAACPRKLAHIVALLLITGARADEILSLTWADVTPQELVFLDTKNGKTRRLPVSPDVQAILDGCPKGVSPWVFTNVRTRNRFTVNGVGHVFKRAVVRAGILTGDVTLHVLRHTAISRMIAQGIDDHTVMAVSGHSTTRMLERYTHPATQRKLDALTMPSLDFGRNLGRTENAALVLSGGRREDRTPDLRDANAKRKIG